MTRRLFFLYLILRDMFVSWWERTAEPFSWAVPGSTTIRFEDNYSEYLVAAFAPLSSVPCRVALRARALDMDPP